MAFTENKTKQANKKTLKAKNKSVLITCILSTQILAADVGCLRVIVTAILS